MLRVRSTALWCATTAVAAGIAAATLPAVAALPRLLNGSRAFTDLLVTGCAAATLLAAVALWAITTEVVVGVLATGRATASRRTGPVRALVLAGCGVVVLGATAAPVHADDGHAPEPRSLAGLPLPDRATGHAPPEADRRDRPDRPDGAQHRVRPGDSLWAIAEEHLGRGASEAAITAHWHRIHHDNRGAIGPDPDLILPGQLLDLPQEDR